MWSRKGSSDATTSTPKETNADDDDSPLSALTSTLTERPSTKPLKTATSLKPLEKGEPPKMVKQQSANPPTTAPLTTKPPIFVVNCIEDPSNAVRADVDFPIAVINKALFAEYMSSVDQELCSFPGVIAAIRYFFITLATCSLFCLGFRTRTLFFLVPCFFNLFLLAYNRLVIIMKRGMFRRYVGIYVAMVLRAWFCSLPDLLLLFVTRRICFKLTERTEIGSQQTKTAESFSILGIFLHHGPSQELMARQVTLFCFVSFGLSLVWLLLSFVWLLLSIVFFNLISYYDILLKTLLHFMVNLSYAIVGMFCAVCLVMIMIIYHRSARIRYALCGGPGAENLSTLNPCLARSLDLRQANTGVVVYLPDLLLASDFVLEDPDKIDTVYVVINSTILKVSHNDISAHTEPTGVVLPRRTSAALWKFATPPSLMKLLATRRHVIVGTDFMPASDNSWISEGCVDRHTLLRAVLNSGTSCLEATNLVDSCLRAVGRNQRAALKWLSEYRWRKFRAGFGTCYDKSLGKLRIDDSGELVQEFTPESWTYSFGMLLEMLGYQTGHEGARLCEAKVWASGSPNAIALLEQRNFCFGSEDSGKYLCYGRGDKEDVEDRPASLMSLIKLTAAAALSDAYVEVIVPTYVTPLFTRPTEHGVWQGLSSDVDITTIEGGYNMLCAPVAGGTHQDYDELFQRWRRKGLPPEIRRIKTRE